MPRLMRKNIVDEGSLRESNLSLLYHCYTYCQPDQWERFYRTDFTNGDRLMELKSRYWCQKSERYVEINIFRIEIYSPGYDYELHLGMTINYTRVWLWITSGYNYKLHPDMTMNYIQVWV